MQEQEIIVEQENAIYNNNYNDLKNKPSINNIELSGNKTLAELGYIPYDDAELKQELNNKQDKGDYALKSEVPNKVSQLQNDTGFITGYTETDPTVPSYIKSITEEDITKWNNVGETIQELEVSEDIYISDLSTGIYRLKAQDDSNYMLYNYQGGYNIYTIQGDKTYLIKSKGVGPNFNWLLISNIMLYGNRSRWFMLNTNDITSGNIAEILNNTNALSKTNTTEYTPTSDYNPATKKYVDDILADIGSGSIKTLDSTQTYNGWELEEGVYWLENSTSINISLNNPKQFAGFMVIVATTDNSANNFFCFNEYYMPYIYVGSMTSNSSQSKYKGIQFQNIITTNNNVSYTVNGNYNPAHKLYVDTQIKEKINGTFTLEGTTLNITTSTTETTTEA